MTVVRRVPPVLWLALACGVARYVGAAWDVSWHRTLGRDSVWSPPHLLLYAAVLGSTFASVWLRGRTADPRLKKAASLALAGNALMLVSAPFDVLWHALYGADTDIWSPPHLLAVFGSGVSGTAWLLVTRWWPRPSRLLKAMTYLFFGWSAYAGWFALNRFQMDATSRDSVIYPSLVGLVVLPLLLIGRQITGQRYGATIGAAALMMLSALPAVAFGLLGWVPPALPPLLFVPAVAADLLLGTTRPRFIRVVGAGLVFGVIFTELEALSLGSFLDALPVVVAASISGAIIGWCLGTGRRPHLPRLLSEAGIDSLLGPAERLRFERMRLGVRAGLLFGPTLLIALFGAAAFGPALLAFGITLGSGAVIVLLLWRRPTLLLRYQLVARLIDVGLVWLSISTIQEFTGRALYDQVYLLPVIAATATHGKRGAYIVSAAAALAVMAARARLVLAGAVPLEPLMVGDAVVQMVLFFMTGSMLDMLMRTSAGVVEQLRRSEKHEAQAALRESEARYRLISELTSDFAFSFRVGEANVLHCEWITEAMTRMTGYTLAELGEHATWGRLIHVDDREVVYEWWAALLRGESRAAEFRFTSRAGEVRLLRAHARPVLEAVSGRVERIYGAAHDITERKRWEQALEHQAMHDALTDLPNRALLQDRLAAAAATAARDGSHLSLMLVDLDRFKDVNDTYGHHLGDLLLQQVGQRLRASLRASDTIARLGGDEFAVLLPNTTAEDAAGVARKLLHMIHAPIEIDGHRLTIGASIGIAVFPEHAADANALLQRADSAMYTAKRAGLGVGVYTPSPLAA